MKKKDLALISETYARNVLNEAVPPYELGSSGGEPYDPSKHQIQDTTKFKTLHRPGYEASNKGFARDPDYEFKMHDIMEYVSQMVKADIEDAGGIIADDTKEMYKRVADYVNETYPGIFQDSFTFHVARNIIESLEEAGFLKYTRTGKEKSKELKTPASQSKSVEEFRSAAQKRLQDRLASRSSGDDFNEEV